MIKAVLFDLDGTLLDTTEGVIESAIFAAKRLGYKELPQETMLKFVGPPIQHSFIEFYHCSSEAAQAAAELFRSYYKGSALFKALLYPGIIEVLQYLQSKGIGISVATYKREDYAITILKHFGIAPFCTSMHGADNFNKLTKADIVNMCIRDLDVDKSEVVLVGDTKYDAEGAQKAGIPFLGVTYGFGFRTKDDVNDYPNIGCINKSIELMSIL